MMEMKMDMDGWIRAEMEKKHVYWLTDIEKSYVL